MRPILPVALLAALAAAPAAAAGTERCAAGERVVLAQNAEVVVHEPRSFSAGLAVVSACERRTGRRRAVAGPFATFRIGAVALRGTTVAVAASACDEAYGPCERTVRVTDVRTGREAIAVNGDVRQGYGDDGLPEVRRIVLGPRGAVAWIACDRSCATDRRLYRVDGRGQVLLSRAVAPSSLRTTATGITWREAGTTRRAAFQGTPLRDP